MSRPTSPRAHRVPVRLRLAVTGLALAGLVGTVIADAPAAQAVTYPTWDEVKSARGKESAKQGQITEIRGIISELDAKVEAAEAKAQKLGQVFFDAQKAAQDAAEKEQTLRADADEHAKLADQSAAQAGQFAAQMSRSGGADVTTSVITQGEDTSDLLYNLGALSKLSEQAERVQSAASIDAGIARSLEAQADRAAERLNQLAEKAQARMQEAQAASDAVQAAYDEQQSNKARLDAQLATLTSGRVRTEAEFAKGERVRKAAEERAAREAAERAAAAQAAQNAVGGSSGGASGSNNSGGAGTGTGSGAGAGGSVGSGSGTGWVRAASGGIRSPYGWRVNPYTGAWAKHDGVDLGSGCSTPIVASAAGTIDYVGWYGGYGNYVRINHGDGVQTAYGHIVDGGFRVATGQQVSARQLIALVGSTGNSTGCHSHIEVHINGVTTDPVPFMAARGVNF
jgi:murein DD-endopeptidase MepM/ murein hydrolase activator NlpD